MDAGDAIIPYVPFFVAGGLGLGFTAIVGWVATTWLRIKNGYPLRTSGARRSIPGPTPRRSSGCA